MMNLAQLVHARWAASARLNALLPVGKVLAGGRFHGDPGTRYATLTLPGSRSAGIPRAQWVPETVIVRARIHHDDYAAGQAIVAALLACLDGQEFSLVAWQRKVSIERGSVPKEMQDPRTGHWDWVTDLRCRVQSTAQ
jgi:hypothetical protein